MSPLHLPRRSSDWTLGFLFALFVLGLCALTEVVSRYGDQDAARKERYAHCLPEPGQRTVAYWGEAGLTCSVQTVGGYANAPRQVAEVTVE